MNLLNYQNLKFFLGQKPKSYRHGLSHILGIGGRQLTINLDSDHDCGYPACVTRPENRPQALEPIRKSARKAITTRAPIQGQAKFPQESIELPAQAELPARKQSDNKPLTTVRRHMAP